MFAVRNSRNPLKKRSTVGVITAILVAGGVALTGGAASAAEATPNQQSVASAIPTCSKAPFFSHSSKEAAKIPAAAGTLSRRCELRLGDTGPGVRALQNALKLCHKERLVVDGRYGATTAAAVKRRQSAAGITPSGIYGESTMLKTKFPLIRLDGAEIFGCAPGSHFPNNAWWPAA